MAAGADGAGPDMSLGVEIRLPFETVSHPQLAADGRVVEMKYFFTRKLMLMKESAAFAVLPGGFGTLDECFELLTLLQTGKAEPAPIVLLDLPGDPYWEGLAALLERRGHPPRPHRQRGRGPLPHHRRRRRGRGGDPRLLPQLPVPALCRADDGAALPVRPQRQATGRAQQGILQTSARPRASGGPARCHPSAPSTTASI